MELVLIILVSLYFASKKEVKKTKHELEVEMWQRKIQHYMKVRTKDSPTLVDYNHLVDTLTKCGIDATTITLD